MLAETPLFYKRSYSSIGTILSGGRLGQLQPSAPRSYVEERAQFPRPSCYNHLLHVCYRRRIVGPYHDS